MITPDLPYIDYFRLIGELAPAQVCIVQTRTKEEYDISFRLLKQTCIIRPPNTR